MSLTPVPDVAITRQEDFFSAREMEVLKQTIAVGASDEELALFAKVCERTGLDPFAKQIYCVMRYNKKAGRDVMVIQTAIDGYRLIAERSAHYRGQLGPFWCGQDGVWRDIWLDSKAPHAAKVAVLRSDFSEPLWGTARTASYIQKFKDGNPSGLWATMPEVMIAKCAESLALRRAFPNDLSGIYTNEEMPDPDDGEVIEIVPGKRETANTTADPSSPTTLDDAVPSMVDPPPLEGWERALHASMGEVFGKIPKNQMDAYRRRLVLAVSGELKSSRALTAEERIDFHAMLAQFADDALHFAPDGDDWIIVNGPPPEPTLNETLEASIPDPAVEDEAIGVLREAIGQVAGLGEVRVLKRARRIAEDNGWTPPEAFAEIEGDTLGVVMAEVLAKIDEQNNG